MPTAARERIKGSAERIKGSADYSALIQKACWLETRTPASTSQIIYANDVTINI